MVGGEGGKKGLWWLLLLESGWGVVLASPKGTAAGSSAGTGGV